MTDLMLYAFRTLERSHALGRIDDQQHRSAERTLASRSLELLHIEEALIPVVAFDGIRIVHADPGDDGDQPIQVLATGTELHSDYAKVAGILRGAGLVCYTPGLWKHPDGWTLLIHWPDADHANRAIEPDEVPA